MGGRREGSVGCDACGGWLWNRRRTDKMIGNVKLDAMLQDRGTAVFLVSNILRWIRRLVRFGMILRSFEVIGVRCVF